MVNLRGLFPHQGVYTKGGSLSSYLFLFCTEILISLLQDAEQIRLISGVQKCKGAQSISYLLFASDSLVFYKANVEEKKNLQHLLNTYEMVSGQYINKEKTALTFSWNVLSMKQNAIQDLWGIQNSQQHKKYSGLQL